MAQCIYCRKNEMETTFFSREHVMPQCLGSFTPLNPTIRGDLVCDVCNSRIFNPLETLFMEDTYEGIYGQRLNLENRGSVIMRGKYYKIDRIAGFGNDFFDQMFLFLKWEEGKVVPDFRNQIKFKRFQCGYRVFLLENLQSISEDSRECRKLSADIKRLSQKDISIFVENDEKLAEAKGILKKLGVEYKEKESRFHQLKPGERFELKEEYTCTINSDLGRVLAKIAFNYFAYCALQESMTDILYLEEFNKIRKFIYEGSGKLKEIIPSISEEPILWEERGRKTRFLAHIINFLFEDGKIVARMTLFGLPPVYKIILGDIPDGIETVKFGCGHLFDPFNHEIYNLSQTQTDNPTAEQIRLSFGLFKRI